MPIYNPPGTGGAEAGGDDDGFIELYSKVFDGVEVLPAMLDTPLLASFEGGKRYIKIEFDIEKLDGTTGAELAFRINDSWTNYVLTKVVDGVATKTSNEDWVRLSAGNSVRVGGEIIIENNTALQRIFRGWMTGISSNNANEVSIVGYWKTTVTDITALRLGKQSSAVVPKVGSFIKVSGKP